MMKPFVFALLFAAGCKQSAQDGPQGSSGADKGKLARLATQKLAFEAYPQWSAAHPDKACPSTIDELLAYIDAKDAKDPWGGTYHMMCGPDLPAGARGLAVASPGPDGKEGTPDDIKSWE